MSTIINLTKDDYYTQRNNIIKPGVACMPTSRVMFYIGNKIQFKSPDNMQPEDYFMEVLNSPEGWDSLSSWIKDYNLTHKKPIPPNEDHFVYPKFLDQKVCGKVVSKFVMNFTFDDVIKYLNNGKVLMTTAKFPESHII